MCRVTQTIQPSLEGSPGDKEKYPVQKSTWFGYTFDVVQKFREIYGQKLPVVVFCFPTFGLLLSSTKLKNLAITSSFSFCFTVVIQRIWQHFDRINKEKIQKELAWCQENENTVSYGSEVQNQFDLRGSHVMAYFQKDRVQDSINTTEDPLYSLDVINSIIVSVDDDLKRYLEECDGLVEKAFHGVKEKIELQTFLDKIGVLLCQVQKKREDQQFYSEKSSQQILEEANTCSQALKGMALAAKIGKELVRLQKAGLLKFKGEELLQAFHENLYKEISFSKYTIEMFCIGFEHHCVYTREEEIKALQADIRELDAQRSVLENHREDYKERIEIYFKAIDITKKSIEVRIRQLAAKNISKKREISRDIFEAALCGIQDSFELVKEKTNFFNDFPRILSPVMFMNGCLGGFVALVSGVFNLTKILFSKQRYEKTGTEVEKYKEALRTYVDGLRESYKEKNEGNEPPDKFLNDNYVRFLILKIRALETSKTKRIRHIIEKFIKLSDDFVTLSRAVKVLVVLVGISVGPSTVGILVTATSIVTVSSLLAGICKFGRKLYSLRHRVSYAYTMISLQFLRPPQFRRLEISLVQFQGLVRELDSSREQLNILENEEASNGTKKKKIQDEIDAQASKVDLAYKAMNTVKRGYMDYVEQAKTAQDNLFVRELADKVNGYTEGDMAAFRQFLNEELLGWPDKDGKVLKESKIARNKAIWAERLHNLGYHTYKPITSELILQFATSTPSKDDSSEETLAEEN